MKAPEMIAKARNLPSISPAALSLVKLLDRADTSNEEIVQALKTDSVLTAKLLRVCNSSLYAFPEEVTSVDQAVLLLGYQQLLQTVLRLAFGPAMVLGLPGAEAGRLWSHSLRAACAAQVYVTWRPGLSFEPSLSFTVGLLHDIGKLVMFPFLGDQGRRSIEECLAAGKSGIEAERAVTGADHAEVGSGLLYVWKLPEKIIEAVANHHSPRDSGNPGLSLVAFAGNTIAHGLESPASESPEGEAALERLRLRPGEFRELAAETQAAYENAARPVVEV